MRFVLLALATSMACSAPGAPPPAATPARVVDVTPKASEQPAEVTEPADTSKEPAWDPTRPLDAAQLGTRTVFVVVPKSAVCPTREQATLRECGNSVEDVTRGESLTLGETVIVVGEEPIDGQWRALRYQKAGILPGWIVADDVASTPSTAWLDAWDQRADVANATDATTLAQSEVARAKKGTLFKWRRTRAVREGTWDGNVTIFVGTGPDTVAAIALPPPSGKHDYVEYHSCLVEGDCLRLSYVCEENHCDEVSILAKSTGRKVPTPTDPETPSKAVSVPLLELVALADRFGLFPHESSE